MSHVGAKAQMVYEYILDRMTEGLPPTVREICTDLDFKSTSTAHKYLVELEQAGLIIRESGLNRNIKINMDKVIQVPVVGTVAAGKPVLAVQNIENYIPFKTKKYNYGELFALNVKGDSMKNVGILDGDVVVVFQTYAAKDNEIIVAMLDDHATVKRFFEKDGGYILHAENDDFEDIHCEKVDILGKVLACIRTYD